MADTIQFDLVSPERRLTSVQADQVQIPGIEGDFTVLPNHSAFLTTLRPGVVTVKAGADTTEYVVTGGFADVTAESATVLAEEAVERHELDPDMIERLATDAQANLESATSDAKLSASQRARDVGELKRLL